MRTRPPLMLLLSILALCLPVLILACGEEESIGSRPPQSRGRWRPWGPVTAVKRTQEEQRRRRRRGPAARPAPRVALTWLEMWADR